MAIYSISDLEKLTGIKAHTLRAWEQRFDLITPQRTANNTRYYRDEDLKELLNVALLKRNGMRISHIARMTPEQRATRVAEISAIQLSPETQLDALTLAAVEMDEFKFSHVIETNATQLGMERTIVEVIYPFLEKLGLLYLTGSVKPIQESFISNLVRRKLLAALDELKSGPSDTSKPEYALYLPPGEKQELSLLFIDFLLRTRGNRTLYLGLEVNADDLKHVYRVRKPEYLLTIISGGFANQPFEDHLDAVLAACPESELLVTGRQVMLHDVEAKDRVVPIHGLDHMLRFVHERQPVEALN